MTGPDRPAVDPDSGAAVQGGWRNWGGNQSFTPAAVIRPGTEAETIAAVQRSVAAGTPVRAAGSGHSFTPIVETNGVLLDLRDLSGLLTADTTTQRATVLAGTTIADLGAPLWDAGLALANQGDVDAQTVAGAIATGTKGSGTKYQSMSAMLRGGRLVTGTGEVIDFGDDQDMVHAAQVSIGMLGVLTRMDLDVVARYRLVEENCVMTFEEVHERWDEMLSRYRHFSFWWCPAEGSGQLYDLGDVAPGSCVVKLLREAEADEPDCMDANARTGRSHQIFPDGSTDAKFHELEYMVPAVHARAAVAALQQVQQLHFPEEISPLQVRWQAGDDAYLSPQHGRDSTSLSVSGLIGTDYLPYLRAVDDALAAFNARPHWGKLHFLTPERVRALYPRFDDFQRVRRLLDPRDLFLAAHLRALFGE